MAQRPVVNGWSQRQNRIGDLVKRLGPFDKHLFNGKTASQGLRINRKLSIPATHDITQYADKLTKLSKYAVRGNVILAGAGYYELLLVIQVVCTRVTTHCINAALCFSS